MFFSIWNVKINKSSNFAHVTRLPSKHICDTEKEYSRSFACNVLHTHHVFIPHTYSYHHTSSWLERYRISQLELGLNYSIGHMKSGPCLVLWCGKQCRYPRDCCFWVERVQREAKQMSSHWRENNSTAIHSKSTTKNCPCVGLVYCHQNPNCQHAGHFLKKCTSCALFHLMCTTKCDIPLNVQNYSCPLCKGKSG